MDTIPTRPRITLTHLQKQILAALFYGSTSLCLTVINKNLVNVYDFPFLIIIFNQMLVTFAVIFFLKMCKLINIINLNSSIVTDFLPLSFFQAGNFIFSLASIQDLNVPVFRALRQFPILMTMVAEYIMFNVKPNIFVQLSVYTIIIGAIFIIANNLPDTVTNLTFIFLNNFFTTIIGVYTKKKLDSTDLGKLGLMYYNSLFMIAPIIIFAWFTGDIMKLMKFNQWNNPWFLSQFLFSFCLGLAWSYSYAMCLEYNSALTTTMIGSIKNIVLTFIGMLTDPSYKFDWWSFIGIILNLLATIVYAHVTFRNSVPVQKEIEMEQFLPVITSGTSDSSNIAKNTPEVDPRSQSFNLFANRLVIDAESVDSNDLASISVEDKK